MSTYKNEFAHRVSFLMRISNLTQQELAEELNVSQATVSNWCNGIKMPRYDRLKALAEALGTTVTSLIGCDD